MIKLLFILLIPRIAFGSFTPQTVLTDISTGDTMSVNSSHEGLIFLGSDSNVCKETGGNLASILAQLQSGVAVTGTFWQSTQPVSGSVSVSNFPSTQPVSGSISVSNFPVNQPVSGILGRTWNLGHASDSVSNYLNDGSGNVITSQSNGGQRALDIGIDVAGAQVDPRSIRALNSGTDSVSAVVSNFPSSQAVTGTFWQSTQPVSGSVSVSNFPSSQAVTGTFWQSVQPISGTVSTNLHTNANATLSAQQTVTGTESNVAAPANAMGVILECESVNADNLRWGFSNSTSTILSSTLGMLCEPGRDSGFLPLGFGTYLHLISTGAGSDFADIQWVLSQ